MTSALKRASINMRSKCYGWRSNDEAKMPAYHDRYLFVGMAKAVYRAGRSRRSTELGRVLLEVSVLPQGNIGMGSQLICLPSSSNGTSRSLFCSTSFFCSIGAPISKLTLVQLRNSQERS